MLNVLASHRSRLPLVVGLVVAASVAPLVSGPRSAVLASIASDLGASEPLTLVALGGVLAAAAVVLRGVTGQRT